MTPVGAVALFPLLSTLAVIGIIYGALAALAQTDIKRLVAYSSVSHMGFIVLGIFAFNPTGLDGSAIQMVNHGLTTGALFACVGMIYERYHTRDMTQLGGLWNRLPLLAFFLILAALGSAAVPGLNGFVGEFPILAGTFQTSRRAGVLGATGMILGACYLFWMLRKVIFGPLLEPTHQDAAGAAPAHHASGHDGCSPVGWHEIAGLTPLMVLIVAIGVFPRPFLEQIRPAVARLDDNLQSQRALANQPRVLRAANPPGGIRSRRGGGGGAPMKKSGGQPSPSAGQPAPTSPPATPKETS
jgi:NADH-quinone oxidoreductase subunit M